MFRSRATRASLTLIGLLLLEAPIAHAYILPYSVRTRDFSSWTPSTRGDINTIGMAGATLAVPSSISAAESNPAGFAMLTGSVTAQINKINLDDRRLQRSGDPIESSQWGLGVSPGKWGFSIAYYSPQTESGIYVSPNTGDTTKAEVSLKELRFTAARSFFDDRRLAVGASLELVKAIRELGEESANAYGLSYRLGALYRLPRHFILGASFSPQSSVGPAKNPDQMLVMPGFNRTVVRPLIAGLGLGWIPNRFFKVASSFSFVGATENTALLTDESVAVGGSPNWVPRVGASYVLAEFHNFKVEGAAGSYFEISRLSNGGNRLHVTGGLEANPYFINLGAGFDVSTDYRNVIVSVGLDIVRTARAFDIIPSDPVPAYNGTFPNMNHVSADGLPDALTVGETKNFEAPSVEQVSKIVGQVPENIAKKVAGEKTTVEVKVAKDKKTKEKKDKRDKRDLKEKKTKERKGKAEPKTEPNDEPSSAPSSKVGLMEPPTPSPTATNLEAPTPGERGP